MHKNSFLRAEGSRQGTGASEWGREINMYKEKRKDSFSVPLPPSLCVTGRMQNVAWGKEGNKDLNSGGRRVTKT